MLPVESVSGPFAENDQRDAKAHSDDNQVIRMEAPFCSGEMTPCHGYHSRVTRFSILVTGIMSARS